MRKNVANQTVAAQMVSATDGSAVTTGTTSVVVTIDGGTQTSVGNATHEGNGTWTIDTGNATNTNGNHAVFTFTNSSAVGVAVQAWPVAHANDQPTVNVGSWLGTTVATPATAGRPSVDVISIGNTTQTAADVGVLPTRIPGNLTITSGGVTLAGVVHGGDFSSVAGITLGNVSHGGTAASLTLSAATISGTLSAGANGLPWPAAWDAEVQSECDDALTAFWTSPATLVDLVWDEATSGHQSAGTTGKALTDAGSAGDPWATDIQAGAYSGNQAGAIVYDNLDATISSRGIYDGGDITGNLSGSVGSVSGAVGSVTGNVAGSVEGNVVGTVAGVTPATAGNVTALLTTQMTESYSADGVAPTLAQALFLIQQQLGDFAISGTTLTVKQLDGSTTAATFTLDDATTPTSVTRAT